MWVFQVLSYGDNPVQVTLVVAPGHGGQREVLHWRMRPILCQLGGTPPLALLMVSLLVGGDCVSQARVYTDNQFTGQAGKY